CGRGAPARPSHAVRWSRAKAVRASALLSTQAHFDHFGVGVAVSNTDELAGFEVGDVQIRPAGQFRLIVSPQLRLRTERDVKKLPALLLLDDDSVRGCVNLKDPAFKRDFRAGRRL